MKERIDTYEKYWLKEYGPVVFFSYDEVCKVSSYAGEGWKGGIEHKGTFNEFWYEKYSNTFFLTDAEKESIRKIMKKAFEAAQNIRQP